MSCTELDLTQWNALNDEIIECNLFVAYKENVICGTYRVPVNLSRCDQLTVRVGRKVFSIGGVVVVVSAW